MTDYIPPCACVPDTPLTDYEHLYYYMYPLLNTSLICIPRFPQLSICGGSAVESSPTRSRLVCCPLSVVRLASTSTPQLLHMSREIVTFSIHHFSPTHSRHGVPSAPSPLLVLGRASARSRCIASLPASGVHWHVKRHSENENDHDHVPTHDCTAETLSEARSKVGRHCRP